MSEKKRKAFSSKEQRNKTQAKYMGKMKALKFTVTIDEYKAFEKLTEDLSLSKVALFRRLLKNSIK